jgi:hypothetical protein
LVKLAKKKDYTLISNTFTNLFFIHNKYYDLFNDINNDLNIIREDSITQIFTFIGYDGTVIHSKPLNFIWHNFKASEEELQLIPNVIRKHPPDYTLIEKFIFFIFLFKRNPINAISRAMKVLKRFFIT